MLADGHFASIDQDNGLVIIETPFDEELASLSAAVNDTYLPCGAAGVEGGSNQSAQDANASQLNSATVASRNAMSLLKAEIERDMILMGCRSISELRLSMLASRS